MLYGRRVEIDQRTSFGQVAVSKYYSSVKLLQRETLVAGMRLSVYKPLVDEAANNVLIRFRENTQPDQDLREQRMLVAAFCPQLAFYEHETSCRTRGPRPFVPGRTLDVRGGDV